MYLAHGLLCRFIVHSDVCNSHCYMCNSHLPLSIDMSSLSLTHPKVSSADAQRKNVKKTRRIHTDSPFMVSLPVPHGRKNTQGAIAMDDKVLLKTVLKAKTETRVLKDLIFEMLNLDASQKEALTAEFEKRCRIAEAIHLKDENIDRIIDASS